MKETPKHKLRYPEKGDDNAHVASFERLAEDTERELDAIDPGQIVGGASGQLLIVQGTGAAAFKAASGDVTNGPLGVFTIGDGKVGTSKVADNAVTTAKMADKSVTLAKMADALGLSEGYLAAAVRAKLNEIQTAQIKDGAVTSPKWKPTFGTKISSALYTPEWEGKISATAIPGTILELNPSVACKLIVHTMWNPRFNKVLAVLQPLVHWTKGGAEETFAIPEMPSHSAERDVNMPYSWTVEVPLTAGSNNVVDLRSYATVESAGKLTLPAGSARYTYVLAAV